jgi:hypothetical protein
LRRTGLKILVVILSVFFIMGAGCAALDGKSEQSHDLAVTNISAPSSCVQGDTIPVIVTVKNQGNCSESFVVTLTDLTYGLEIGNQTVTLSAVGQGGMDEIIDLIFDSPVSGKQYFGWPPACGDVNGDGYDDLLAPASMWNNAQGRAYLYYGGKNMDTTPDKTFTGEGAGDIFGDGCSIGDVNGDKYCDVIVAAPGYSDGAKDGRVYIYYGGPDMDDQADLILEGESGGGGYYGVAIGAGDVDKDGYDDVIVTAVKMNSEKGRAYLYYGGDPMDNICDLTFDGENEGDCFGRTVFLGDGDVNGDNYADVLIGARDYPSGSAKGRAYLFYGGDSMDNICDKAFTGESNRHELSQGVAIFDVDNDGFGDVICGANQYNGRQGRVYIYWGEKDMDVSVDKVFTGEPGKANSEFGCYVWGGHVNDDEYGDIIIGAFNYYNSDRRGRAHIYYGDTIAKMDEVADCTFSNDSPMSDFGMRLTVGDVNGDGHDDAIINGWKYNNEQGRIWLYYGGLSKWSTDLSFDWDTIKASTGEHTLKAETVPVTGEKDAADNTMTTLVNVKSKVKEK